ncbi:BQ2448_5998 [Microbotryum intermedium]|uniref:BQ2448_5998 protein n=1 Tax=Microbotryum intermedium TaxID=269621 RepID=A0A238EZQ7_9BASI|nr:BQ2448_5998 [Microbotryum intermedium]
MLSSTRTTLLRRASPTPPSGSSPFPARIRAPSLSASPSPSRSLNSIVPRSSHLSSLHPSRTLFTSSKPRPPGWKPLYRRRPVIFTCIALPATLLVSVGLIGAGLLAYDASTYHEKHIKNVNVDPLALSPHRGGKKNLKIAEVLIDDTDDENHTKLSKKQRMVIVGGGWGSVGILKHLDPDQWHVTVVAPDNYFLFHPLLPSATVGTVEVRSLVEPLRKIIARVSGHYLQAKSGQGLMNGSTLLNRAVDVDFSERLLEVQGVGQENFYLPYDRLIIACGSINSTHGVPGLEHCHQLKTVSDAQGIRRRVMDNLERACLPETEQEERARLLSFVVCGGGPTGVEFASELFDMINEDVMNCECLRALWVTMALWARVGLIFPLAICAVMPKILRDQVSVHIIQSRDHILNTYAETISQFAEAKFSRDEIDTILNARVKEVRPDQVIYTTKGPDGKLIEHSVKSGFTLWSTGIAMNPFTARVASLLPNQYHKHALEVDSHLRVIGAPLGTVYALGDCATIETRLVDHLLEMVERCDEDHDGSIDNAEFKKMMKMVNRKFPTAQIHVDKIQDIFEQYARTDKTLGMNELADMFINISQKMTNLPATAQVANQQGVYLGKKFSKIAKVGHEAARINDVYDDPDDMLYHPFKYRNLGSLAYVGNSAVFDLNGYNFAGGLVAMYLWRSVYWSEQVSTRTRVLLMLDWIKRGIFGRDLSKF